MSVFIINDALTPKLEEIQEKVKHTNLEPAFKEAMTIMADTANEMGPVMTGYIANQTDDPVIPEYDISSMVNPPTGHYMVIENPLLNGNEVVGELVYSGADNPINKKPIEYAEYAEKKSSGANFISNMVVEYEKDPSPLLGGVVKQLIEIFK